MGGPAKEMILNGHIYDWTDRRLESSSRMKDVSIYGI